MVCPGIGVVFVFYDITIVEGLKCLTRKDTEVLTTIMKGKHYVNLHANQAGSFCS